MEKKTLMQAIASNKADIISTLGLTVRTLFGTTRLMPGIVIKTDIAKADYFTARLEITTGMGHNTVQNNVLSVNFPFYSDRFLSPSISRETYEKDIISSVTAYVDTDRTVSFYLKSKGGNFPAYTVFDFVAIGSTAMTVNPANRIVSVAQSDDAYQEHDIEKTVELDGATA